MKYLFIIFNLLLFTFSRSQNLVPNYSFETYTLCPNATTDHQIESAIPWNSATTISSTDYLNACSSSANVPNYLGGFQYAHTGNAYAGLYFLRASSSIPNSREYMQVQLTSPLVINKVYYVEFYVNLLDVSFIFPCNNIMANLSATRPFSNPQYSLLPLTPHIVNSGNPITGDTLNWTKISGCYTAQGGEEYLTIGNFMDDVNTQTTGTTTNTSSYYLVDDVLVEEITGSCTTGINELSINEVKLFPNPVGDALHINVRNFKNKEALTVKLYDVLGKEALSAVYKEELDLSGLEKGIYFLSLYQDNQLLVTKKVVKE